MELTPRAKRTLTVAERIARSWGHPYVGTEHILLALIDDQAGIAGAVLREDETSIRAKARIEAILDSEGYRTFGSEVVDSKGNVLGQMTKDEDGVAFVDQDGTVTRLRKNM